MGKDLLNMFIEETIISKPDDIVKNKLMSETAGFITIRKSMSTAKKSEHFQNKVKKEVISLITPLWLLFFVN